MLRIITDTSSDITCEEFKKLNVEYISLNVAFGSEQYKEEVNITKEEFYLKLTGNETFPITSQPQPTDLMDILEDAKSKGDEVVGIFLSSKVSGTFNTCMMIKNQVELDNCYFIDSLTGSAGLRILIMEACKLRDEGKNAEEIAEKIEPIVKKIKLFAVADTLDYLAKGGRISALSSKIGNLLKFKPLISVIDGKTEAISKPRGLKSAIEELVLKMVNDEIDYNYPLYGMYSGNKDNALKFIDKLFEAGIEITKDNIYAIGAVIGSHLGPDGFGVAYVSKK